jgi:hypothetical protein
VVGHGQRGALGLHGEPVEPIGDPGRLREDQQFVLLKLVIGEDGPPEAAASYRESFRRWRRLGFSHQ